VFFLLPRNPFLPEEDQLITSPLLLVRLMIRLLNVALDVGLPEGLHYHVLLFLLAGGCAAFAFLLCHVIWCLRAIARTLTISYLVTFFLFATVFRLPLRVRLLVRVR
jgi:hypothetical protein